MNDPVPHTAAVLFVRRPVKGQVKTRLASALGNEGACDFYSAMTADAIAQIKQSGLPLFLFHDGEEWDQLPPEWNFPRNRVFPQRGENLGERISAAFGQLFAAGVEKVVLTGSDIPGMNARVLQAAAASLDEHGTVIVPAADGGYCLIASRRDSFTPAIFTDIPWSTSAVLGATLERCRANGLNVEQLEQLQDIDTLDDLRWYCRQPSPDATATNAWLSSRGFICQAED